MPRVIETAAPEDWRILRLLSFYRLALVALLLTLLAAGYTPQMFSAIKPDWYRATCQGYALLALLLSLAVWQRQPRIIRVQSYLHFMADLGAIATLVYASGGLDQGLGALLMIPTLACALVLPQRLALLQAANGTLVMFGEEFARQAGAPLDVSAFTSTGVLGMILFGTSLAASMVAQRARSSEALAQRMGSEFDNLSRLNEVILESMHTGVLVLYADLRIANLNAAARELLRATNQADGRALEQECPTLAARLRAWLDGDEFDETPFALGTGMAEVSVRASRLGSAAHAPILLLIEDASRLQEQAQQIKLAALGRLSASIAHEIRNPLAAISHAGQLLDEAPEIGADNRRLLAMIHRHSDRIDKIVQDVMALSRREVAQPQNLALAAWLQDTVALYAESHADGARSIVTGHLSRELRVQFDPHHLQQLLFNLWDNAFRHGASDGRVVQVRLSAGIERGGRPWLDVADNGPGIPAELVDRIFEPFFTTAHGGTGLGLYLARELCELNQARMSYQRRISGACFRISFTPGAASAPPA